VKYCVNTDADGRDTLEERGRAHIELKCDDENTF